MSNLPVNRRCSTEGCDSMIQATEGYLNALVQDNEYVTCPKGHEQPLFPFASVEQERDWLFRRLKALHEHIDMLTWQRNNAMTCPFRRRGGIVLRDALAVVKHAVRKHRGEVEDMIAGLDT